MSDIQLYCGLSEKTWNGYPVSPGAYACISPISGRSIRTKKETCVYVPDGTQVIQDSGAFSDSWSERLTFQAALKRQIHHAQKYGYETKITHRATYDLLIDEVWNDGNRLKRRWTVSDACEAVEKTVNAAIWLNQHRESLSLIISAQGVDASQYLECVKQLLPLFRTADILGLGGWCITGKMPREMMPTFTATVSKVIPFIAQEGINRVHIWGVIYPPALAYLLRECQSYNVEISTDSMGPCIQPAFGQWGYGSWRNNSYKRPSLQILGEERGRHAAITRQWLDSFSTSVDFTSHFAAGKCDSADRRSVTRPCLVCGNEMAGKRNHSKTCSARCRKTLSRS